MVNLNIEDGMSRLIGPALVVVDDVEVSAILGDSVVHDTDILQRLEQIDRKSSLKSPVEEKNLVLIYIPIMLGFGVKFDLGSIKYM